MVVSRRYIKGGMKMNNNNTAISKINIHKIYTSKKNTIIHNIK